jgi:ABC-type glycerol-3-phosphate transport system substrate-binding protein
MGLRVKIKSIWEESFMKSAALRWLGATLGLFVSTNVALADRSPEVWHYFAAGSELAAINGLMEYSNKIHADTPVIGRAIPGNVVELRRQLQTAFLGGNPPAVYQSAMGYELKTFVDGGRLRPIDDVWAAAKGEEIFPKGVQRVVKVGGKPWGIPVDISIINNIFYNKAIFEKYGIEPPRDWAQLVAACKKLRDNGIEPLGDASGPFWSLYNFYAPLLASAGKDGYYAIAQGKVSFKGPEFRKALETYRDTLVVNYAKNWSGKTWTQTADDVINGHTGMFMMGVWVSAYFKEHGWQPGKDFDFFPAPGTDNSVLIQMDVFAEPAGPDKTVATARNFMTAAASVEGQVAFNVPKGALAPNLKVDPSIYDYTGQRTLQQLKNAETSDSVLPNLFFLLPTKLGTELGVQIEKFAIDPSAGTEESVMETLEALRLELAEQNAFVKW